ncbi:MAG: hypothetical protein ABI824_19370 [Acidobacteriota bacterium]
MRRPSQLRCLPLRWIALSSLAPCLLGQAPDSLTPASAPPDVMAIIRRSVERDAQNFQRYRDYTFEQTTVQYRFDKQGGINSTETETDEVLMLVGQPYNRVLARDGTTLSEKDARKEQEKLDKELVRRQKDPEKKQREYEKDRADERRFLREIPDAYTFTLEGEEKIDNLPVWRIRAEPKPDFKPKDSRANMLSKVRGTLWIEQTGYQWVKADLDVIDTISWGWFVLRIPPGATIQFTQRRVNQEVWMPESIKVRADARVALLKTLRMGFDVTYSKYRKFSADSKVIGTEEIPETKTK